MEQRSRIECKENGKAEEFYYFATEIPLRFSTIKSFLMKLTRGGYKLPNHC